MNSVITYESNLLPFEECLSVLEHSGKRLYGDHFHLAEEDYPVIFKLLVYFMRDYEVAKDLGIDHGKGIFLTGPIGCGKTSLMNLMRYITSAYTHHVMVSCRKVSFEFNTNGYSTIGKYSDDSFCVREHAWKPKIYCFDDLGAENSIKYYGNDCNVMGEILLSRYDLFVSHSMLTHVTTNLTSGEIEAIYGGRVRSRMRSMFNLVAFDGGSGDKRC